MSLPHDFITYAPITRTISFNPTLSDAGDTYTITCVVEDSNSVSAPGGTISTNLSFDILVTSVNYPPVFDSAVVSSLEVD